MKLFSIFMAIVFFSANSFAECDFSKITKTEDGNYLYSKQLHLCVGEMQQDLKIAEEQKEKLNKALDLKDLVILKANDRADDWMNVTFKLEDRLNKIDKYKTQDQWTFFTLGVVTMFAASYAASQLNK